jgi:hypothetical protein
MSFPGNKTQVFTGVFTLIQSPDRLSHSTCLFSVTSHIAPLIYRPESKSSASVQIPSV